MSNPGPNILVVDDNATNRKLLVAILHSEGYGTAEASDGAVALDLLDKTKIDAIISDILMPNMDGYRLCYELRRGSKHPTIPFIFLTATYTSPADEKLALELGADRLLKKPVSSKEIVQALRDVLRDPTYKKPRAIAHPKTIEVIEKYRDALVTKLEEKTAELQKTTEDLKTGEELFRLITENAADLIAVLDLEGRRLYNSPSYKSYFGDPHKLQGTDSFREIHADDRDRVRQIFYETIVSGIGARAEYRFVLRDGSVRHIESQGSLVRDHAGKPTRVVVVSRDVTERKKAERALEESEQKFRLLFEANPHPMWYFDPATLAFLDVNEAAVKHYGYTRQEFLSMTIREIRPPEDVVRLLEDVRQVHKGLDIAGLWRHKKKDGTVIDVEITSHEIDYSGRTVKVVLAHDITQRVMAERELKKLSSAVEQAGDNVLITNKQGVIEYVNPAFERTSGFTREFAVGKTPRILKSGKQSPSYYENLWHTIQGGRTFRDEVINMRKTGDLFYEEQTITPIVDAKGEITHFVSTGRDITERKHAEDVLRESERRFREMLENVELIAMTLDRSGVVTFCNDYLLVVTGWNREEVIGADWFSKFIPPEDSHVKQVFVESLAANTIPGHFQNHIVTRSGALRQIRWNNVILRDDSGAVAGTASIGEDITDRQKAEKEIRESEERFRQLTDTIKEVFWMNDPQKNEMLYVSRGYEDIWGMTRESALSNPISWIESVHHEDRDRIMLSVRSKQVLGTYDEEYRIVRPDGTIRWIHDKAFPILQGDKVTRIVGVAEDVTERKSLEQQLRQAQKLESLGTLAGGIAHDFNNILAIILGHASLLSPQTDPERLARSIDAITKASDRGAGLVRQLLAFARKTEPVLESVNVNDIILELTKLLDETFPKAIGISLSLGKNLPGIAADGNQLHQIFLNLCVNARDAMGEGGTLAISTSLVTGDVVRQEFPAASAGEYVCARISDTGTGIEEAARQRIFEPFFTTKEVGKGTGLGLSVVYGIVKSLNGHIGVSSSVGQGTTFRLYFPIIGPASSGSPSLPFEIGEILGGNETILLMEDEEMLADLLATLLETKGYTVLRAMDGEEAVNTFRTHMNSIALVISDLGLPKLDGFNAFLKMKEISPNVKAIIATGYVSDRQESAFYEAGVKEIIVKPYIPQQILKCVREVLDARW